MFKVKHIGVCDVGEGEEATTTPNDPSLADQKEI
jgi:hypothetical protein